MKHGLYRLNADDRPALESLFFSLSEDDRRMRFGYRVADDALRSYVWKMRPEHSYGWFSRGQLAAVAELAPDCEGTLEFAVSVHPTHQGRGLGTLLRDAMLDMAAATGTPVLIHYVSDNARMGRLAKVPGATKTNYQGDVEVRIDSAQHVSDYLEGLAAVCSPA